MDAFARRLRQLRQDAGEKQTDLQEALHCSQGMVSAYENGREPPFDMLISIARHYDVSTDYLLGLTSDKRHHSDALTDAIHAATIAAEANGMPAVSVDDLQALFVQLRSYAAGRQTAGARPAMLVRQIVLGLTGLLFGLCHDSPSTVITEGNNLLSSILDISNITADYLNIGKDVPT